MLKTHLHMAVCWTAIMKNVKMVCRCPSEGMKTSFSSLSEWGKSQAPLPLLAEVAEVRKLLNTLRRPCTNSPVSYLKEAAALQRREHLFSVGVRKRQRVRTIWWETAGRWWRVRRLQNNVWTFGFLPFPQRFSCCRANAKFISRQRWDVVRKWGHFQKGEIRWWDYADKNVAAILIFVFCFFTLKAKC